MGLAMIVDHSESTRLAETFDTKCAVLESLVFLHGKLNGIDSIAALLATSRGRSDTSNGGSE